MPKKTEAIKPKKKKTNISIKSEKEIGGPKGPEPTRHGDWHIKGRVSDF